MSAWKKYEVTVTRRWYDREAGHARSAQLPDPVYVMAHTEKQAAENVRRRYKERCGGPALVTYTCEANEVEEVKA